MESVYWKLCYDDEDAEELDVDFEMDFGGEGGSEIRLRCCDDSGCCWRKELEEVDDDGELGGGWSLLSNSWDVPSSGLATKSLFALLSLARVLTIGGAGRAAGVEAADTSKLSSSSSSSSSSSASAIASFSSKDLDVIDQGVDFSISRLHVHG